MVSSNSCQQTIPGFDSAIGTRNFKWVSSLTCQQSGLLICELVDHFFSCQLEITQQTSDTNVHLIIIDYDSEDIDVDAVLQVSSVDSYTVLKLPRGQTFIRSEALQLGADAVKDPHSILFLCDLHLSIPSNLINLIRRVSYVSSTLSWQSPSLSL